MNTNFTFRDFFVYLVVGVISIFSISLIFIDSVFFVSTEFFYKYEYIKDFSIFILIFLIPIIYLIGHIIGGFSYHFYRIFIKTEKYLKKKDETKFKKWLLKKLEQLLFRQRISYAIRKNQKKSKGKFFIGYEEFWSLCAKLQVNGNYKPAEYWYVMNELFNSLNIVFFISSIIALIAGKWILAIVYIVLAVFSFTRARQYAHHFVKTVIRINKINALVP